jgi:AcrR family transcriptional regulator
MRENCRRFSARDRRQQIIQVATELFARQGYKGTTTQQIAQQAGVNEALIFRHFPHKERLYWAILDGKCRGARGRQELREKIRASCDDRELFRAIAGDLLRHNAENGDLSRLLLFSALEHHHLSHRFFRTYVAQYYETLAKHIRKRIREGAFRRTNPLLAARGFLGMVIYHGLIQELFGGNRYRDFDARKVSTILTDIWLGGMLAANNGDTAAGHSDKGNSSR